MQYEPPRGHLVASVPATFYSALDAIASLDPADVELVGVS
jgi:hypothetical protein